MILTADIQSNELENQTFHLTPEQREAALLQVYLELQLPPASARQAAHADLLLIPRSTEFSKV